MGLRQVDRLWEQAVSSLQRAALEPQAWEEALDAACKLTGGRVGNLLATGGVQWLHANWYAGLAELDPADMVAAGVADPARNPRLHAGLNAPVMQAQCDDDILGPGERDRYDIYRTLDREGTGFATWISVYRTPDLNVAFVVGGDHHRDEGRDREAYMRLARLARQTIELQVAVEERGADVLAGALEGLSTAAFLCAADGRVRRLTPAAEAMLRERGALCLRGGVLYARRAEDATRLAPLIAHAARDEDAVRRSLMIADPSGGPPVMLDIARLRRSAFGLGFEPEVLVMVRDNPRATLDGLRAAATAYGLTAAETQIAALMTEGLSVEQVAEERAVAVGTVRTHVRSLFAKTGVNRQTELIRLMLGYRRAE